MSVRTALAFLLLLFGGPFIAFAAIVGVYGFMQDATSESTAGRLTFGVVALTAWAIHAIAEEGKQDR